MTTDCRYLLFGGRTIALFVATSLLATGCSAPGTVGEPGTRAWSDQMGQAMRAAPENASSPGTSAKKQPFWEKYRDKRVNEINQNLNFEEPTGW